MGGMSLSLGLGLGAYRSGGGFSPASLFAASEPGGWYDPSDLTTLFQDTAGTVPVTASGQTVGLLLDKSKGLVLGPELVTSGAFAGILNVSGVGASQNIGTIAGRSYQITYRITALSGAGTVRLALGTTGLGVPRNTLGTFSEVIFTPSGSNTQFVYAFISVSATATLDNISVKELPGNHATQATAASRPILRTGSKIDYDGVDDFLRAVLPNLGINATLVRAVQGVGTTILTGQTIAAGNYDDSTDHCGLLLINRPLTAGETAQITAYMNQKAGV